MEKLINKILDRYFARKVIALVREHLAKWGYNVDVLYDKVLQEHTIVASFYLGEKRISVKYFVFTTYRAPEALFELLAKGWNDSDVRFCEEVERAKQNRYWSEALDQTKKSQYHRAMDDKTYDPVEITLTHHGRTYKAVGLNWDCTANEMIEVFTRLMVVDGFSPNVIIPADGGRFKVEYLENQLGLWYNKKAREQFRNLQNILIRGRGGL